MSQQTTSATNSAQPTTTSANKKALLAKDKTFVTPKKEVTSSASAGQPVVTPAGDTGGSKVNSSSASARDKLPDTPVDTGEGEQPSRSTPHPGDRESDKPSSELVGDSDSEPAENAEPESEIPADNAPVGNNTEPELEPGGKTDPESAGNTDPESAGKTDPEPADNTELEPAGNTDPESAGKTEPELEPAGNTDSEPADNGKSEPEPTGKTKPKAEPADNGPKRSSSAPVASAEPKRAPPQRWNSVEPVSNNNTNRTTTDSAPQLITHRVSQKRAGQPAVSVLPVITESHSAPRKRRVQSSRSDSGTEVKPRTSYINARPGSSKSDSGQVVESNVPKTTPRPGHVVIVESNIPKVTSARRPQSAASEASSPRTLEPGPRSPRSHDVVIENNVPKITVSSATAHNTPAASPSPVSSPRHKVVHIESNVSKARQPRPRSRSRSRSSSRESSRADTPAGSDDDDESPPHFEVLRNRESHVTQPNPSPRRDPAIDRSTVHGNSITVPFTSTTADDQHHRLALSLNNQPQPPVPGYPHQPLGANLVSFPLGNGLTGGIFLLDPDRNDNDTADQPIRRRGAYQQQQAPPAIYQPIVQQAPPTYYQPIQPQATPLYYQQPIQLGAPRHQPLQAPPTRYQPLHSIPSLGGGKKPVPDTTSSSSIMTDWCSCGYRGSHHHHLHLTDNQDPDSAKDDESETFKPYPPIQTIKVNQPAADKATGPASWHKAPFTLIPQPQYQQQKSSKRSYSGGTDTNIDSILGTVKPHQSILDQLAGYPPERAATKQQTSLSQYHQLLLQQQQQQQQPATQLTYNISLGPANIPEKKSRRPRSYDVTPYDLDPPRSASDDGIYPGREEAIYDYKIQRQKGPGPPKFTSHNDYNNNVEEDDYNNDFADSRPARRNTINNNGGSKPARRNTYFVAGNNRNAARRGSRDVDTQMPLVPEPPSKGRGANSIARKQPIVTVNQGKGQGQQNNTRRASRDASLQTNGAARRGPGEGQPGRAYFSDQETYERRPGKTSESSYRLAPAPGYGPRGRGAGANSRQRLQPPRGPQGRRRPSTIPQDEEDEEEAENQGDSSDELDMNLNLDEMDEYGVRVNRGGKLVTFFRNGDRYFTGLPTSVNKKQFQVFETLLVWLSDKIPTPSGVKYIFRIPDGREITELSDLEAGRAYVVSSVKRYARLPYGNLDLSWYNTRPSASRYRRGEPQTLLNMATKTSQSQPDLTPRAHSEAKVTGRGRLLTIISNSHRDSQQKVLLNPDTTQNFDEMLSDVGSMIKMQYPPVTALYMAQPPYRKMESFIHLMKATKYTDTFIACGREGIIREMQFNPVLKVRARARRRSLRPGSTWQPSEDIDSTHVPAVKPTSIPGPAHRHNYQHKPRRDRHWAEDRSRVTSDPSLLDDVSLDDDVTPPLPPIQAPPPVTKRHNGHVPPAANQQRNRRYEAEPSSPNDMIDMPAPNDWTNQVNGRNHHDNAPLSAKSRGVIIDIHGHAREFFPPRTNSHVTDNSMPEAQLHLDWAYGYNSGFSQNLHSLPSGDVIYIAAAVAVIFDKRRRKQRHYSEHTEDITCLAVHASRVRPLVATGQGQGSGQRPSKAMVRVWSPQTLVTVAVIGEDVFDGGVFSVAFSHKTGTQMDGSMLLAVDDSERHVLTVWQWEQVKLVAKTTTVPRTLRKENGEISVSGSFHPSDFTNIVTYGRGHVYFWKIFMDQTNNGLYNLLRDTYSGSVEVDPYYKPRTVTALAFANNGDVITGDSDGQIMVWSRSSGDLYTANKTLTDLRAAHKRPVTAMTLMDDGTLVTGAAAELKAWDTSNGYRLLQQRQLPEVVGVIRAVATQSSGGADGGLLVGTSRACILEGSLQGKFDTVVQGHSGELWAVTTGPVSDVMVTAGYDHMVCKWNLTDHQLMWRVSVDRPCLSVALDPSERLVALASADGRLMLLSAFDGLHLSSIQVGVEKLDAVTFSPDGKSIAIGCHDNNIYIYNVLDSGHALRKAEPMALQAHQNFITHIDWASNGEYLQSVSGDYDLVFCVWANLIPGSDVNSVDRSKGGRLLAAGDNHGTVRLYRYPCLAGTAQYREKKFSSGYVSKVRFSVGERHLVASSGKSGVILQWTLVNPYI